MFCDYRKCLYDVLKGMACEVLKQAKGIILAGRKGLNEYKESTSIPAVIAVPFHLHSSE